LSDGGLIAEGQFTVDRVIRSLNEVGAEEHPLAGGKGGMLARLRQAGYPVPDGFLILPHAFNGDELENGVWKEVQTHLASLRHGDGDVALAVRSSALGEDAARDSFAGEFETVLDVRAEEEIDFILGSAHWGHGFATEAGRANLRYGFEEIGLDSVVGTVHPENAASRRVLEKLGMTFTGQATYSGMACYRYAIERLSYDRVSRSWKRTGENEIPSSPV
jgi:RimJ/RimL family protein N-acetyltransferase